MYGGKGKEVIQWRWNGGYSRFVLHFVASPFSVFHIRHQPMSQRIRTRSPLNILHLWSLLLRANYPFSTGAIGFFSGRTYHTYAYAYTVTERWWYLGLLKWAERDKEDYCWRIGVVDERDSKLAMRGGPDADNFASAFPSSDWLDSLFIHNHHHKTSSIISE